MITREVGTKMVKIKQLVMAGVLAGSMALGAAQTASAAQTWPFGWWPGHWKWMEYTAKQPYLENGKDTQNQQWAGEDWYVQDWLAQHKDGAELVNGFYKSDILREQTDEKGVPVLIVGANFYHLGGFDKRRVITTVDSLYGITESGKHPMIILRDWYTKKQIGLFTAEGLQLE